ncbi:MAG: regulatory protein RecX [Eubacteriales bacterium]|nr:regulatory protein RecX [Eubacteriales bacterium]
MKDLVTGFREERNGYRVTVNDTETFRLSFSEYRALPLQEGQALDWAQYKHDLLVQQYPEALDRAVRLLAVRARSRGEVEQRLTQRGYLPDTLEMVIYKLEKEALLDDEAFARAWAKARADHQIGKARILQELRVKGVDSAIAEAAVAELAEDDQHEQAAALAAKLLKRHHNEPPADAKRKALAAMQRRGYAYGEASRAVETAVQSMNDETE